MTVEPHDSIEALEAQVRRERDARVKDRLRAVVLARRGREHEPIAEHLGMCPRWVEKWVARYNRGGVGALRDKPRSGQPPRLPRGREEELRQRVLRGPGEADGGVCTLRGQDIRRILQREFGVRYALSGVYDLLHRLGMSSLVPRPRHRKNDPAAMEEFKKSAPLLSGPSAGNTPTGGSRSGSWMRPATARRAR